MKKTDKDKRISRYIKYLENNGYKVQNYKTHGEETLKLIQSISKMANGLNFISINLVK